MTALASLSTSPADALPDTAAQALSAGCVVALTADHRRYDSDHEHATRAEVARRIAALRGTAFSGEHRSHQLYQAPVYFVPSDTLDADTARGLGIRDAGDLFGGVVPHPFVGTKVITHPLVAPDAARPDGWNPGFCESVRTAVLSGFSAFSREDAMRAGRTLLREGPVRVKPACATGGRGQTVVEDVDALGRCIDGMPADEIDVCGLVLEENLCDSVVTLSVGQVVVGGLRASYHGVQRTTTNSRGDTVYGGSDLVLVRGDFDALLALELAPSVRLGIEQARRYHQAATECFEGFHASRINYDVAQGRSSSGESRSGVLEQSWRLGGATGAEIAGLEHFRAHPGRNRLEASCFEEYGVAHTPPGATVYFSGVDERAGQLVKYTVIHDAHTQ